jgi:hypothetical protein
MVRFKNVSAHDLILHLKTTYAKITSVKLEVNEGSMKQQKDVRMPFKYISKQIKYGADFMEQVDTPFAQAQLVKIGYNAMLKQELSMMNATIGSGAPLWSTRGPTSK